MDLIFKDYFIYAQAHKKMMKKDDYLAIVKRKEKIFEKRLNYNFQSIEANILEKHFSKMVKSNETILQTLFL